MSRWANAQTLPFSAQLAANHIPGAAQTVIVQRYISASGGVSEAGFDSTVSYQERSISAWVGQFFQPSVAERQSPGGNVLAGEFKMVTREPLTTADRLTWQGVAYRVESISVPSQLNGTYTTIIRKAT